MASLHEGTGNAQPSHSGTSSPSLTSAQPPANQHYLLSPVPASQALSSSSKPGATGATGASGPDSTTSITLYPLEPVPPHLLCAICTLPYENPVHFLPCCHVFCLECIQLWIGMNLSDDLLQNELRRAYPAGDDLMHASSFSEEPLTYELSRMGDRSRSGTSGALYDSYSGLPPMAQVHQRQVAIILENREMPKCPMCRTGLHIHAWDRIEEQIKVPISVGPRPQSTPSTEWFERSTNQRPVSGVQRRRLRSDRHLLNERRGLGRQDSIGEEDEEEEIEMEHVGARGQDVSPSPSSFGRHPPRRERTTPSQQHHQFPRPVYPNGGFNYEDDDIDPDGQQSPTTAIIGRRPSEWMRYQQRQLQAHQAQSNRQRNDASDQYDDQQEQIRRLYLEQESQEELLRTLTARAASILEAGAQRQTPPNTALSSSTHSLSTTQSGGTPENNERDLSSDDREGDQQNIQMRRSMLHVDTSATRPSSRQSSQVREVLSPRSPETAIHRANRTDASMERDGGNQDDQEETSDDNNSIIDALQQGTRAWQRPSSLQLDLEETGQPLVLSLGETHEHGSSDGESPQGYSRSSLSSSSVSSATPSSGVQSSTLALSSPTNTHSFSYRTSSTYSHHMTQMSSDTTFSQSPVTNQWDQPLGLQMPTLDNDRHQDEARTESGSGPGLGMLEGEDGLNDTLEEIWRGTQTEDVGEAPSTTIDTTNEDRSETTGNGQTEETGSTSVPNSMSSSTSEAQHLDPYFLQSSEIQTWKSTGSSSTSGVSPMVRELDIHSPIVTTAEGSVTTIADMQIDADILARARSGSMVLSDDDEILPTTAFRAHRHNSSSVSSSPVDSPIPTPSTARPRQRFPAGIRLAGEGDEEVEQEDVDEEGQETFEHAQEEEDTTEPTSLRPLSLTEDVQASDNADVLEQDEHRQRDEVDDPLSNQLDTHDIQDPLSVETPDMQESVPGTTPLRSTMSSPPPLPVPLDTIGSDGVDHQDPSSLAAELTRATQQQQEQTTPGRSRPISVIESRRQSAQDRNGSSIPTPTSRPVSTSTLAASVPQAQQAQAQEEEEEEEESPQPWPSSSSRSSATSNSPPASSSSSSFAGAARRTEDHVQYRTLVRYQPRLPKAHVMSDLISQIRVECPQRAHGCLETMEMQQMPQHGREQCRFRPVMCPRARCGLWMRADQILEHILMVEQPTTTAPTSLGPTTRPQSNKSSTRRLNRTPRQGSTKDEVHPHATSSSGNSTSRSSSGNSSSSSSIPPCPGLTWEREQLTRATGIIGQLTEENTSLRQMIRQLQLQNSKLVKEKDRFQRYANLVGRD
ncbi:hypothetical protein CPB97_002942 [Podila verticillata]|nr:hypothetical protein CPB97_002942 [Podila verticillata]